MSGWTPSRSSQREGQSASRTSEPECIGRYELLGELGRGGMATVHLARWSNGMVERHVALKLMRPEIAASEDYRAMFREEARIATRLRHQFLVDLHEVGEADGRLYFAMEYLEGISLADVVRARAERDEAGDVALLMRVFAHLAEGLHAIHTHGDGGYVHRDVSPQNLFVLRDGSVRITDFGVALDPAWPRIDESGMVKGKVAYLAPELLSGAPATATVDLWALGVVLWEALAGQRLFVGRDLPSIAQQVRTRVIPAPSTARSGIPPELDALVLSMLSRDWQERPRSGRDISYALSSILLMRGLPVEPAHVGEWTRSLAPRKGEARPPMRYSRPRMRLPAVTVSQEYEVDPSGIIATTTPPVNSTLPPPSRRRRSPAREGTDVPDAAPPPRVSRAKHALIVGLGLAAVIASIALALWP